MGKHRRQKWDVLHTARTQQEEITTTHYPYCVSQVNCLESLYSIPIDTPYTSKSLML